MTQTQLIQALHQIGAIKFGTFTLKSGQSSKIYLDLRQIISWPEILTQVADILWEKTQHCHFDLLCGVPYTALPIATCMSVKHHIPMVMRRKEKKTYGTKQQIEGNFKEGQTCLVVEDVLTTGASVLETANDLTEAGLKIRDAVVLINREQGGEENLRQHQCTLHAAFTLKTVLTTLKSTATVSSDEQYIIQELLHETT